MSFPTRQLGKNGPEVVSIGAGLMSLGHAYGHAGDDATRMKFLDSLYAQGATNWDNADIYGDAEELVGRWFAANPEKRKDVFLSTNFGYVEMLDPTKLNTTPDYVKLACERSLKKLQTDYIDIYYMHRTDGKTPIEETVKAMKELKEAGKIRHLGLSEVSSTTLRRAHAICPISALQTEYSPFTLDIEGTRPPSNILATCPRSNPVLMSQTTRVPTGPNSEEENFPKNLALVQKIQTIAEQKHVTPPQLVLAWLMQQYDMVIPIPGTRNIDRMLENLGAAQVNLTPEESQEIRKIAQEADGGGGDRYPEGMMGQLFGETPEMRA